MLQWLILLCVLIFTGCATGLKKTDYDGGLVPEEQPMTDALTGPFATVKVESHNLSDVKIFILHGDTKFRIGLVQNGSSTLKLKRSDLNSDRTVVFRLEVFASNEAFTIPAVMVEQGDVVHLNIESMIQTSNSVVWNNRK